MLEIIIAFGVGALFGVGMTCCLVMAGRTDKEMRQMELDMLKSKNIGDEAEIS